MSRLGRSDRLDKLVKLDGPDRIERDRRKREVDKAVKPLPRKLKKMGVTQWTPRGGKGAKK